MLNLATFDPEFDSELLSNSYKSIRNKSNLQIINDGAEHKEINAKILSALTIPNEAALSLQNLFKITLPAGRFYIAQCLLDFGYPVSRKLAQSYNRKYNFQLIGFAGIKIDLGMTVIRRETKTDKIINLFTNSDIDFEGTEKFNDKYYLTSDKKEAVHQVFGKNFINTIAGYDNVNLLIKNEAMFITFENEMQEEHSAIAEDIFCNCNFLA